MAQPPRPSIPPSQRYFYRAKSRGPKNDPLDPVTSIGARSGAVFAAAFAVAFLLHGTAAARTVFFGGGLSSFAHDVAAVVHAEMPQSIDVDVEKPPEPPKAPEPEPEPEKAPTPKAAPVEKTNEPPPPPAAAEAGKVVTSDPDPNEPVDLRGAFVSGNGESYAGGSTAVTGTSKVAVRNSNAVATGGVPQATGKKPGSTGDGPDLSRPAGLLGSADWRCDWPSGVPDDIDDAYVTVQVDVGADGRASNVDVTQDPGHGFGGAAKRCAQTKSYQTALDHDGRPLPGKTRPFRVHFDR